jgi:large subunit ribosomal protein LX
VTGKVTKPNWQTSFQKEIRALRQEEALDHVYKEIGSKHKAKRFQIKILKVEEIKPEEVTDLTVKKLTLGEKESVK